MVDRSAAPPQLMLVRAITASPPFATGDAISVAFATPTVGTLLRHEGDQRAATAPTGLVPNTFSARVVAGAEPYATGDLVTLSFIDVRYAHIHRPAPDSGSDERTRTAAVLPGPTQREPATTSVAGGHGVLVRIEWTLERARRFVRVVDKLFTVDRLGWYRHVLAMRLLIPDDIDCDDAEANQSAALHLRALRTAATETLGRPLLAAFMPNFVVTPDWLDSIESLAVARAIAALRDSIAAHVIDNGADIDGVAMTETSSLGIVTARDLAGDAIASADAFLAAILPSRAADAGLSSCFEAYRSALADTFGQTARSTEAVRLGRMSEANHVLDDRLWQLVGTLGHAFGGLAVA